MEKSDTRDEELLEQTRAMFQEVQETNAEFLRVFNITALTEQSRIEQNRAEQDQQNREERAGQPNAWLVRQNGKGDGEQQQTMALFYSYSIYSMFSTPFCEYFVYILF